MYSHWWRSSPRPAAGRRGWCRPRWWSRTRRSCSRGRSGSPGPPTPSTGAPRSGPAPPPRCRGCPGHGGKGLTNSGLSAFPRSLGAFGHAMCLLVVLDFVHLSQFSTWHTFLPIFCSPTKRQKCHCICMCIANLQWICFIATFTGFFISYVSCFQYHSDFTIGDVGEERSITELKILPEALPGKCPVNRRKWQVSWQITISQYLNVATHSTAINSVHIGTAHSTE